MALYLQMDGVDDYIKLPTMTISKIVADVKIRRRTDVNRYVWDFRSGIGFSYLMQQTNGIDSAGRGTVKINGGAVANSTAFIPHDTRVIIEHDLQLTGFDDGNIFSVNSAAQMISGDIFDIKLYNGTTLVAHYNMTTGAVQDQSGNGNHATLTGGTWVDDGVGGSGTPVTKSYSTKQTISATRSTLFSSKQTVFAPKQTLFASKQVISKPITASYQTQQTITHVGGTKVNTLFQTKQHISLVRTSLFDMKQEIKGKFTKILNFYPSSQTEMKLEPKLGDTALEVVTYMGQTIYQPNDVRTVSEMEVTL